MAAGKESAEGAGKSEGGKRTERNAGPGSRRSELEGNAETERWHWVSGQRERQVWPEPIAGEKATPHKILALKTMFLIKKERKGEKTLKQHIFSAFWPHLRARAFISPPHTQSVIQSHQGSGLRLLNPSVASPNTTPPPPLTQPSGPPQRHLSLRCRTPCHLTRAPGTLNRNPLLKCTAMLLTTFVPYLPKPHFATCTQYVTWF